MVVAFNVTSVVSTAGGHTRKPLSQLTTNPDPEEEMNYSKFSKVQLKAEPQQNGKWNLRSLRERVLNLRKVGYSHNDSSSGRSSSRI